MTLQDVLLNATGAKDIFSNILNAGKGIASGLEQGQMNKQAPVGSINVMGPTDNANFDANSFSGKIQNLMQETGLDTNSQEMQDLASMLTQSTAGQIGQQLGAVKSNLMDTTGVNTIKTQETNLVSSYLDTIKKMPGYASIQKNYMDKVNNDDLNYFIGQLSKNRDSVYEMMLAEAKRKGDIVNPYEIMQNAKQVQSMYDTQINQAIDMKKQRVSDAKDYAKLEYEDMMNRVKISQDMLDRVRTMKQDALEEVKTGTADYKWLAELDATERKMNKDYKLRLKELQINTGFQNAELLFKMKDYENKTGETLDPTQKKYYLDQAINAKTSILSSVIDGKENASNAINVLSQQGKGLNTYVDLGGIVGVADQNGVNELLGKQGGTVAWRTNNPGNIIFSGNNETAKWLGAVGVYQNYRNLKENGQPYSYLVFKTPEDGANAMAKLMLYGKSYRGKTVAERLQMWQGGSTSALNIVKQTAPQLLNKRTNFTNEEMNTIASAVGQSEGWKEGTLLDVGSQTNLSSEIKTRATELKNAGATWQQTNQLLKQEFKAQTQNIPSVLTDVFPDFKQDSGKMDDVVQKLSSGSYFKTSTYKDGSTKTDFNKNQLIKDLTGISDLNGLAGEPMLNKAVDNIIADYGQQLPLNQLMSTVFQVNIPSDYYANEFKKLGYDNKTIAENIMTNLIESGDEEEKVNLVKYLYNNVYNDANFYKKYLFDKFGGSWTEYVPYAGEAESIYDLAIND